MNIDQIEIEKIIKIAQQAGTAILKVYDTDFSVYEKSDQSPLTEADLAAHRVIANSPPRSPTLCVAPGLVTG